MRGGRENSNLKCTCTPSPHQQQRQKQERHVTFDANYSQPRNFSRSRLGESTIDSSIEGNSYDASMENSSYMIRKNPQRSLYYDASFEDSVSRDESYPSSFLSPMEMEQTDIYQNLNSLSDHYIDSPSQNSRQQRNFENQMPQRSRSRQRSQTHSPNAYQTNNARRNLFTNQSNQNSFMNVIERNRRNQLHELLGDESLLDVEDDPQNAQYLGYIYRVDSFR